MKKIVMGILVVMALFLVACNPPGSSKTVAGEAFKIPSASCKTSCPSGTTCNNGVCVKVPAAKSAQPAPTSSYHCIGSVPGNSSLCTGDDISLSADTPRVLASACTTNLKCEYTCTAGLQPWYGICLPPQAPPPDYTSESVLSGLPACNTSAPASQNVRLGVTSPNSNVIYYRLNTPIQFSAFAMDAVRNCVLTTTGTQHSQDIFWEASVVSTGQHQVMYGSNGPMTLTIPGLYAISATYVGATSDHHGAAREFPIRVQ